MNSVVYGIRAHVVLYTLYNSTKVFVSAKLRGVIGKKGGVKSIACMVTTKVQRYLTQSER